LIVLYEVFIRRPYTSYENRRKERRDALTSAEAMLRRQNDARALAAQTERMRPVVEREAAEMEAREEASPDPLRKQFIRARRAAEAERDAAIQAVKQAERRCQGVINEEAERQRQRLDDELESGRALRSASNEPAEEGG
jgi:hypothetical protein